ncbi:HemK/PrmC family methyltransferase [Pseudomonas ogarae]|uniref:Peptide chain release factor N(5)-glutamine methyltransferase n=1 Tax=Pseudomonas ogarae (strain DSM 112162 / CECT 30235 / F113) TaxID=1114970 RepID=A0ABM6R8L0_PSEO1|nr:HemK/PrmC family methyltransferase [Pseudomonas ogarae]AUO49394.1 peptide chain release factor N(5)-glutamine methyltransferase [Pseudomonas ogarae]
MINSQLEHDYAKALAALINAGVWDPIEDLQAIMSKHFSSGVLPDSKRLASFRQDVADRCARTPLGHILGYVDFADLRFVVGSGVFVPRVQSMAIVQWIEQNLSLDDRSTVYDLCAGVGAIGLAIWSRTSAKVVCVEIDAIAQIYLKRNIQRLNNDGPGVTLCEADITQIEAFESVRGSADVIVSNPPYVPQDTVLLPEWGVHHPATAIFAPDEGTALIEASARLANSLLKPCGTLLIEHGESQEQQVGSILEVHGFSSICTFVNEHFSDATGPSVTTVGTKV